MEIRVPNCPLHLVLKVRKLVPGILAQTGLGRISIRGSTSGFSIGTRAYFWDYNLTMMVIGEGHHLPRGIGV